MLIVITGPIASGKSAVAGAVARDLERSGVRAEVIDLDLVYRALVAAGAGSGEATWAQARAQAGTRASAFLQDGVAVVIAEGSFNRPADRAAFARHLRPDATPVYVTLLVSFEEALRRAQRDPTRGVSRDPAFLGAYFATNRAAFAGAPPTDLVIDTERTTVAAAAEAIRRLVPAGRG
jgi:adenylylsulfate kinase-like enzyme